MKNHSVFLILTVLVVTTNTVVAERPTHDGKVLLFGNLHAHSKLSDDITGAGDEMLPIRAFEFAHQNGLDFLAITDHHKATNSPSAPGRPPLRMTENEYKSTLHDVAAQYNVDHAGEFIAIPGIEWGNTKTGNHVNVFGAGNLPSDDIKDADYDELFEWAADNAEFIQFNHPNSWKSGNKAVGNFGQKLYSNDEAYVLAVDPVVKTVSIICTVEGGHIGGTHRDSTAKTHREMQWENHYKRLLNLGFHLSPAANQDTHGVNWGVVTAARTAVWADSVSYDDLMVAFKSNRVYASEDDEMAVALQVEYKGQKHWMGETVSLEKEIDEVDLLVKVWQGQGSDGDPTNEGPYTIDVLTDPDGIGGRRASIVATVEGVSSETVERIPLEVEGGQYVYVRVTEENGQDNPIGQGEDVLNNDTDDLEADGKRDDLNDSAWTSPIWFEAQNFVWSKNSDLYHDSNCWAVSRIGAANRRSGPAPAGKTKHNCHP